MSSVIAAWALEDPPSPSTQLGSTLTCCTWVLGAHLLVFLYYLPEGESRGVKLQPLLQNCSWNPTDTLHSLIWIVPKAPRTAPT